MTGPSTQERTRAVFSSARGIVRVYTRCHINGCALVSTEDNHCSCPKWIYSKASKGRPTQRAAKTSSFTEAREQAQGILASFAPAEISVARELSRSQTDGKFLTNSRGGTVRVYTRRHINDCSLVGTSNNGCSCSKWIYSKPAGGRARQVSARTGSFTEACRLAEKILEAISERPIEASDLLPTAQPKPAKRTRGRKKRPEANKEYFKIANLVEEKLASGMELTKVRLRVSKDETKARLRAGKKKITYATVALYHRKFLRLRPHPPCTEIQA